MEKKFAFDTLEYAKMLEQGGVTNAQVHSASLAESITQNMFTKPEIEKMFEVTIKQFEQRTYQIRDEMRAEAQKFREEVRADFQRLRDEVRSDQQQFRDEVRSDQQKFTEEVRRDIAKSFNKNIAVLGSLILFLEAIPNFLLIRKLVQFTA